MFLVLLVLSLAACADDVDGTWTGTGQGSMGDFPVQFKFKADGAKLTRSTGGRQLRSGRTSPFSVTFDFGGMPFMLSYKGIVSAQEIKMSGESIRVCVEENEIKMASSVPRVAASL
jgi:hypothetical protein